MSLTSSSEFWDTLASHLSAIEDSYFDLRGLRRIVHEVRSPALVIGAGQGLIVRALTHIASPYHQAESWTVS